MQCSNNVHACRTHPSLLRHSVQAKGPLPRATVGCAEADLGEDLCVPSACLEKVDKLAIDASYAIDSLDTLYSLFVVRTGQTDTTFRCAGFFEFDSTLIRQRLSLTGL